MIKRTLQILVILLSLTANLNATQIVDSLNNLAWQRYSDFDEAIRLVNAALVRAEQIQYPKGAGQSYNLLGAFYMEKGLYEEAKKYFLLAGSIRDELKDSIGLARVYTNLCNLQSRQGFYFKAIEYGLEAVDILGESENLDDLGIVLLNLGISYDKNDDTEKAFEYLTKAERIMEQTIDTFNLANVKYYLGHWHLEHGNTSDSKTYLEKSLQLYDQIEYAIGQASAHQALGNTYVVQKSFEKAAQSFYKSQNIYTDIRDTLGLLYVSLGLGDLHLAQGKHQLALEEVTKAKQFLTSVAGFEEERLVAKQYSDIYKAMNQYQKAYEYQEKAIVFDDSLINIEKNRQIIDLQTQYDTEKLKRENTEKEIENQQKTAQRNIFLGLASFFLISLFVAFFYHKREQQTLKIIGEQKEQIHQQKIDDLLKNQELKFVTERLGGQEWERERIARELHDNLGSMMVSAKWQYDQVFEQLETEGRNLTTFKKANDSFANTYNELRRISQNIGNGNVKRLGLKTAIQDLAKTISETGKISVKFTSYGFTEINDDEMEKTIYQIIQELMSNVLKHARATEVNIQLNQIEAEFNIIVEDNGRGFDTTKVPPKRMGLLNINGRVKSLQGQIDIDSGKGSGTTVLINLPIKRRLL